MHAQLGQRLTTREVEIADGEPARIDLCGEEGEAEGDQGLLASDQARHAASAWPIVSSCWNRTRGIFRTAGSTLSFSSQRSSESRADWRPRSAYRLESWSISAWTPNLWAKRRSSPTEAARSFKSTKCVLMRRSAKKRRAARVSALFLRPKIWTSTGTRSQFGSRLNVTTTRSVQGVIHSRDRSSATPPASANIPTQHAIAIPRQAIIRTPCG